MNLYFDYLYYRMYRSFYKYDGESGARALVLITGTQTMLIGEIILLLLKLKFTQQEIKEYSKIIAGTIVLGLGVAFLIMNYKRYYDKYNRFHDYWKNESKRTRQIKGVIN
jgi:putative Mn2+ efflux pump MntP